MTPRQARGQNGAQSHLWALTPVSVPPRSPIVVEPGEGSPESGFSHLLLDETTRDEVGEGDATRVVVVHGPEYFFGLAKDERSRGGELTTED